MQAWPPGVSPSGLVHKCFDLVSASGHPLEMLKPALPIGNVKWKLEPVGPPGVNQIRLSCPSMIEEQIERPMPRAFCHGCIIIAALQLLQCCGTSQTAVAWFHRNT